MQANFEGRLWDIEGRVEETFEHGKFAPATAHIVTPSGVGFDDSASNFGQGRTGPAEVQQQWFCRQVETQHLLYAIRRRSSFGEIQPGRTKLALRSVAEEIRAGYKQHSESYRATHGSIVDILWKVLATMRGYLEKMPHPKARGPDLVQFSGSTQLCRRAHQLNHKPWMEAHRSAEPRRKSLLFGIAHDLLEALPEKQSVHKRRTVFKECGVRAGVCIICD